MQRQCHGLAAGQDTVQVTVEFIDQPRGLRVLGRVQRLDFRLQRICDVDVALRPLHRTGDVVGERHDKRGLRFGLFREPGRRHGVRHQSNDLRRYLGQQFRDMVRVSAVGRNEHAHDFRVVDALAGFGLESQAAPGDDDLAGTVLGEYDVVVEHAKNFHGIPSGRSAVAPIGS